MALGLGLAVAKTLLQVSRIQLTIGFVDKPIHSCRRSLIQQGGYLQFHDHTWHSWREHTTQIPDSWRNLGWAVHTKYQWRGFCEAHRERMLDTEDDQGNINPVVLLDGLRKGRRLWRTTTGLTILTAGRHRTPQAQEERRHGRRMSILFILWNSIESLP